jgi:hypothetical protein
VAATVTLVQRGDADAADRILDTLEADTGWRGERDDARWRCGFADARDIFNAEDQVLSALQRLAPDWREHFTFER